MKTSVAGVFEGGGAKGVAYAGALEALLERGCWFGAVAGSSAGAITAALIAAEFAPTDLSQLTRQALSTLSVGGIRGIPRVAAHGAYLDDTRLREWLTQTLVEQCKDRGAVNSDGEVTFAALYKMTEIELNVVAADLTASTLAIFSHHDTPDCDVVQAVRASCAIPFILPGGQLITDYSSTPTLIADGGVWSNFPTFVFRDRSFRRYHGRDEFPAEDYIIGFLLDEHPQTKEQRRAHVEARKRARFTSASELQTARTSGSDPAAQSADDRAQPATREPAAATEAAKEGRRRVLDYAVLLAAAPFLVMFLAVLLAFFVLAGLAKGTSQGLAGATADLTRSMRDMISLTRDIATEPFHRPGAANRLPAPPPPPRLAELKPEWPEPRSPLNLLVTTLDLALGAMQPIVIGLVLWLVVAWGTRGAFVGLFEQFFTPFDADNLGGVARELFGRALVVATIAALALTLFVLLAVTIANYVVYGAARQMGWGLATTYVAGPGAPPWTGAADVDHVVRISIPPRLTTLSFDVDCSVLDEVRRTAHAEAGAQLEVILGRPRGGAPVEVAEQAPDDPDKL